MVTRRRCFSILSVLGCLERYIKRNRASMYMTESEKGQGYGLEARQVQKMLFLLAISLSCYSK